MPTVKQYQKGVQKIDPLTQNKELLNNPSVQAMLKTIRYAEGTSGDRGYNTRVGYSQFDDLSKKPGKKVYIPAIKDYSSAEGAYQFLNSTWDGVSKKLGLKDFYPESQDLAAIELIKNRGALTDVLNNNLIGALSKLSKEWASLPTAEGKSAYGNQKSKKVESLANVFYGQNSNYENSVAPYMNAPQVQAIPLPTMQVPEIQTQQVSYLETQQETPNLAEETKPSKINPQEEAFMQDLLSQMAQGVAYVEPEKPTMFQDGGAIPISSNGMYEYPNQPVIIPSSRITMKDISHPILAITDQGDKQILQPEKEYQLKGNNTLEIPLTKAEENFLKDIYKA